MNLFRTLAFVITISLVIVSESEAQLTLRKHVRGKNSQSTPETSNLFEQRVNWNCYEMPLVELASQIEKFYGVNVVLDVRALEGAAVAQDSPITLTVRDVSFHSALHAALDPLRLVVTIRNEALLITTQEEAESTLETRVYPVRDVLGRRYGLHREGSQLIDIIKKTTGSPNPGWIDDGGVGDVELLGSSDSLIVSQTGEVHLQIEELLLAIRAARRSLGMSTLSTPRHSFMLAPRYQLSRFDDRWNWHVGN